jgi:oligopeptide/dipeptide ABC transporter ATP-binding protein
LRLIEPTSGELKFKGNNLLALKGEELKAFRRKAQIVFQDPYASLNPRKTIRDNIGEGLLYHGLVKTKSEQSARVAEILSLIGLPSDSMMRYPHQFSGGQQQRICIGRAVALNPDLIVCDEALSALDVSVQAQMLNLLQELKEKYSLSYLFISHDLSCIKYLSDRIIVLYLGKVMEKASVKDLFQNPRHPYTQALLSAIPKNHPLEEKSRIHLHGEIPSAINPPSGCPFRTRCPYAQPVCAFPPPLKIIKDSVTEKYDHEYYCILD